MDKMEYYSVSEKEGSPAMEDSMHKLGKHYAKINELETEREILCISLICGM